METATIAQAAQGDTNAELQRVRVDLAAAHRLAVLDDLHEGSWNHMSVKVPGAPERLLLSPCDRHWSQVTASSLAEVGPEDAASLPSERPGLAIAYGFHQPLHAARPDIGAVVHTHSPNATALGMIVGGRLELSLHPGLGFFHDSIAYSDDVEGDEAGFGEAGENLARWLGSQKTVLFIRNHGLVVTAPSVGVAYTDTFLLERSCMYQMLAMSTGKALRQSKEPPHAFRTAAEAFEVRERHFTAMKRVLDETQPDYAD